MPNRRWPNRLGVVGGLENPKNLSSEKGWKMTRNFIKTANSFLSKIYIKAALLSSQKETALNNKTAAISVIS